MENVTDRTSNPFGMNPPHETPVPGYGDANADFHVIGDHPGVHGGADTGVPFTGTESGRRLQRALAEVGLLADVGDKPEVENLYLSYLHMAVADGSPDEASYRDLEPFFDAELRAITAHVLIPVGERAIDHVLREYTARHAKHAPIDPDALHAEELLGAGFLVVPAKDPSEWTDADERAFVDALADVLERDYRRETDLGRFLTGPDPYRVR
ncbi:uracil-DNA glycosylase family protein [Salarchaeum sp. JOR-1]|uniref:uracil-DNA glycosylase family protein n=1 Tax=Salarchaeum sp. JOR-1 TaxID=2599399 RepID=UPI0011988096|nr:uracil-DNA glycosylase family protein [Salarchaeum sp. JOR-1]QDX39572.1 uracil-DNA glycosylase [Salarchaeum sp. JOR-1]